MESNSRSICPKCLRDVDATVFEDGGRMFIRQECPEHGTSVSPHVFQDKQVYASMKSLLAIDPEDGEWSPDTAFLDVTGLCNMNCPDCFKPQGMVEEHPISLEELVSTAAGFGGSIIYLFGGEPTMRDDLPGIIGELRSMGYHPSFFTNGIRLGSMDYASSFSRNKPLIVLSLDTLDAGQGIRLYGEEVVGKKMGALKNLLQLDIPVFLNVVLRDGVNEDQVPGFIELLRRHRGRIRGLAFSSYWNPNGNDAGRSVPASKSADLVCMHLGTCLEDFLECTRFGFCFSQLMRKMSGRGGRRVSACYLRLYLVRMGDSLTPLNHLLDMQALSERLSKISVSTDFNGKAGKAGALVKTILAFLSSVRDARAILFMLPSASGLWKIIAENDHPITMMLPQVCSIIANRYFDASNVDYEFMSCCSLGGFEGDRVVPFCLREVFRSRESDNP
ncbi:MAG: radical SAM protein [Candidatus Altiarchaeota archaeon]